jgi:hypothetical protein
MKPPIQERARTAERPKNGLDCFVPALALGELVLDAEPAELLTVVVVILERGGTGRGEWCSDTVAIPLGLIVPGVAETDPVIVHSMTYRL